MDTLIKGIALTMALTSTMLAGGCVMDRDGDGDMGHRHMSDRDYPGGGTVVAFDFGTVRYGYSDGYWDNGHQWHRWNNDADMQAFRSRPGVEYRDWHHDRDGKDGWDHD